MSIDLHAHLAREDPDAPPFMRKLFDVEGYLERQAEAGIELTVLSHALEEPHGTAEELEKAKLEHDFLSELISRYPDRLAALAGVDPFGGSQWLTEGERALQAGFVGLCLPTSSGGKYLDDPAAADTLAFANERGGLVFLHPSGSGISVEQAGDPFLAVWIGRPADTGICLSRLLLADTLARYPNVRVVVAHSGGVTPMLLGRLDHVQAQLARMASLGAGPGGPSGGPPAGGPPGEAGKPAGRGAADTARSLQAKLDDGKPSERVGQLYFDTASYHPAAIRAAIEAVGIERVVLGTDHPPVGDSPRQSIDVIEGLELGPDDRDRILSNNARELLERSAAPAIS